MYIYTCTYIYVYMCIHKYCDLRARRARLLVYGSVDCHTEAAWVWKKTRSQVVNIYICYLSLGIYVCVYTYI